MSRFLAAAKKLIAAEEGATMVEYGVMIALIAAVVVGTVLAIGQGTSNAFTKSNAALAGNGIS
jgi:pilus assembly protein Flp/PilA